MPFKFRLTGFLIFWIFALCNRSPFCFHQSGRCVEMNCAAMTILRYAPAVRDLHRHQQGIASLQTHALSANFGDELTRHNVDPFILVVVQMEWRATIGVMFSWRKD